MPLAGLSVLTPQPVRRASRFFATCFTVLKYLIMAGTCIRAVCSSFGTINYVPGKHLAVHKKLLRVAPAVQCTMILSCQFFIVYGAIQVARTWTQFTGQKLSKIENAMQTATASGLIKMPARELRTRVVMRSEDQEDEQLNDDPAQHSWPVLED